MARLRLAGLVSTRKEGRRVICSRRDGHLRRLVDGALNVADHRLGDRPPPHD
jgi:DNA-binding transcriptional ArsR family regulator